MLLMFFNLIKSTSVVLSLALGAPSFADAPNPNASLIAAVVVIAGADEPVEVWINTREEWNTRQALTDSYDNQTRALVDNVTQTLNLCNLAESSYSPCRQDRGAEELIEQLEALGVEVPADFQSWAQSEANR